MIRIGQRALTGIGWESLNRVGRQLVQFGISILLARLLLPEAYGLVGMATVFVALFQQFGELGLGGAIVQQKNVTREQLASIFWLNLTMGAAMLGLAWVVGPLVAEFYHAPEIYPLFLASSAGVILRIPCVIPRALLYKNMEFKKIFFLDWASSLLGGGASIAMALMGWGAWSLVGGSLISSIVTSVMVWIFSAWRPSLAWAPGSLKTILSFSVYYLGVQVVQYLSGHLDYLIIGRFFSAELLGLYTLAFNLMDLLRLQLVLTVMAVMFPVFAHLQDDEQGTHVALSRSLLAISLAAFPALAGLGAVAPEFIGVFYGPHWSGSVAALQLLVIGGIAAAVDLAPTLMIARGKARRAFALNLFRVVTFFGSVMIGLPGGIYLIALTVSLHSIGMAVISQLIARRLVGFTIRQFGKAIAPAAFGSVIMVITLAGLRVGLIGLSATPALALIVQIVIGAAVYALALYLWPGAEARQMAVWLQARVPLLQRVILVNRIMAHWERRGKAAPAP